MLSTDSEFNDQTFRETHLKFTSIETVMGCLGEQLSDVWESNFK